MDSQFGAACAGHQFGPEIGGPCRICGARPSDTPTPPQAEKLSDRFRRELGDDLTNCDCGDLLDELRALESDRDAWRDRADSMAEQLIAEKSARMKAETDALEANAALAHSQDAIKAYCDGENAARQDRDAWKVRAEKAEAQTSIAECGICEHDFDAENEQAVCWGCYGASMLLIDDLLGSIDPTLATEADEDGMTFAKLKAIVIRASGRLWMLRQGLDAAQAREAKALLSLRVVQQGWEDWRRYALDAQAREAKLKNGMDDATRAMWDARAMIEQAKHADASKILSDGIGSVRALHAAISAAPPNPPEIPVGSPCPICTARASEDGLTRYAQAITEQCVDLKRELAARPAFDTRSALAAQEVCDAAENLRLAMQRAERMRGAQGEAVKP